MIFSQNYFFFLICLSWNWIVVQAVEDALSFARTLPAASLLHDQIYFFGGTPVNNVSEQNFALSLNLSVPFDINSPPWTRLEIENPNTTSLVVSGIDNVNNSIIYIFVNPQLQNATVSVYKFDENIRSLEKVETKGDLPLSRYKVSAVSDNAGKFFLFGGGIMDTSPNVRSNEMNIYDSLHDTWGVNVIPSKGDSVLPMLGYSATFLDGLILYIGGQSGTFMNEAKSIDEYPFNTVNFNS
jgi:hypothetical protein